MALAQSTVRTSAQHSPSEVLAAVAEASRNGAQSSALSENEVSQRMAILRVVRLALHESALPHEIHAEVILDAIHYFDKAGSADAPCALAALLRATSARGFDAAAAVAQALQRAQPPVAAPQLERHEATEVTPLACLDACLTQFDKVTGSKLGEFMPSFRKTCLKVATAAATRRVMNTAKDAQRLAFGSFCLGLVSSGLVAAAALKPQGSDQDWQAMMDTVQRSHGDSTYRGAAIPATKSMIMMLLSTGSNIEQLREAALAAAVDCVASQDH